MPDFLDEIRSRRERGGVVPESGSTAPTDDDSRTDAPERPSLARTRVGRRLTRAEVGTQGAAYEGAFEAVLAVAIAVVIGWFVDDRFGTAPWGILVGAVIGFAALVLRLFRMAGLVEEAAAAAEESPQRSVASRPDETDGILPPADRRPFGDLSHDDEPGEAGASEPDSDAFDPPADAR